MSTTMRANPVPDFHQAPWVAIWEVSQACDLACLHCRASAQAARHPLELTTEEGRDLLDQIRALQPPVLVFTGGDPLKRPDIFELVQYAAKIGLVPAFTPSATPLLTPEALERLAMAGLRRVALSLDGPDAATHDAFRGVSGSFDLTLRAAQAARQLGLELQINTTVRRSSRADLTRIASVVEQLGALVWSVFFLVPVGRALRSEMLNGDEAEDVFATLLEIASRRKFAVRTAEALHYRRYLLQHKEQGKHTAPLVWSPGYVPLGISDGCGFVFISHTGEVYPSGFLPVSGGNIRRQPLGEIYRNSPMFRELRERDQLKGKCGVCEFRKVCGGSRSRAFAVTGDWMESDPSCSYIPKTWQPQSLEGATPEKELSRKESAGA